MATEILMVIAIGMFLFFCLGVVLVFRQAEYILLFTSKQTFKGIWAFWKKKIKDGKIVIGDETYIVEGSEPFIYKHVLLGHVPAYLLMENNPQPIDITKHLPKSKLTASAITKLGKMAAIEKIMEGKKKELFQIMIYIAIGVVMGAGIVMAGLFMGIIKIPVGTCLSNPQVLEAARNMTMMAVIR